jgi:hypothetical protein
MPAGSAVTGGCWQQVVKVLRRFPALVGVAMCLGPAVVHGQTPGTAWRLSPGPLFSVGGAGGPADLFFTRIAGALRLSGGRFVVADGGELRLSVHEANGRLTSTFGRDGEGPGEFRGISAIWNAGGDTIGAWDTQTQRITHFLPDGTVVRTDRLRFGPEGPPVRSGGLDAFLGAFSGGRIGLAWLFPSPRSEGGLLPDRMVFGLFDSEGRFQQLLGDHAGLIRIFTGAGSGPIAFSPFPWPAVVRDTLVYTNGLAGEVLFFHAAPIGERAEGAGQTVPRPVRSLLVPGPQVPLEDAWVAFDGALRSSERSSPMIALARATDRSLGEVPRLARMFADDHGRLWLKEYDPATDALPLRGGGAVGGGRWRIVETDGTPVAHLMMPADVAPLAVYGDQLLAITRDALDVQRFEVYRILR